ncbi:hypothetical protein [Streptomyces sp. NPDC045369]|uniref:hypothetical protein n=1 Tax=Streptomyces sp. NPDC045369 TaxID=3155732 RepID=UPI003410BE52
MTEEFQCDYDGGTLATVQADPDGFVEVEFRRVDADPAAPVYLYLAPESARRFARTVTLASIAAEGERPPGVSPAATPEPADWPRGAESGREELFLKARALAGPAASLADVLRVAAYLDA